MTTIDKNGLLVIHTPFAADAQNDVFNSLIELCKQTAASKEWTNDTANALMFTLDLVGCLWHRDADKK